MDIDYLTCGRCLKEYPLQNITLFIEHKKLDCNDDITSADIRESQGLQCLSCPKWFMTAVGLLRHAQIIHNLKLFLEKEEYFSDITYNKAHKFSSSNCIKTQSSHHAIQDNQVVEPTDVKYCNQSNESFHFNESESQSEISSNSTSSCVDQSKTSIQDQLEKPLNVTIGDDLNSNKKLQDDTSPYIEEIKCEENPTDYESFNLKDPNLDIPALNSTEINGGLRKYSNALLPPKNNKMLVNKKQFEYFKSRILKHSHLSEKEEWVSNHNNNNTCVNIEPDNAIRSAISDVGEIRTVQTSKCTNYNGFSDPPHVSGILLGNRNLLRLGKTNALLRKRSHLLKPGPVFSVPIQYNIPNQIHVKTKIKQNHQNLNHKDSRTRLPVTELSGSYRNEQSGNYNSPNCSIPFVLSTKSSDGENSVSETKKQMLKIEPIEINEDNHKINSVDVSAGNGTYGRNSDISVTNVSYIKKAYRGEDIGQVNFLNRRGDVCRKRRYPTTKPFKCEQCDCAFNQRIHLKKHMSKHTGIKPYKCQHCDYSTVERSHLTVHIRTHTGEKPFKCIYCEYATAQKSTLNLHLKRHHIET